MKRKYINDGRGHNYLIMDCDTDISHEYCVTLSVPVKLNIEELNAAYSV